jgi:hypothetical protein
VSRPSRLCFALFVLGTGLGFASTRASATPPNISRYACETDADCVVVTTPVCEACGCPGAPSSIARRFVESQRCRAPRPATRPSTCQPCPPAEANPERVEAVCREQMCSLRVVPAAAN